MSRKPMPKLILLSPRTKKRIRSTTKGLNNPYSNKITEKKKKKKRRENLAPIEKQSKKHRSAPERIRSTPSLTKTVE
jgi:hypothetical protein